MIVIKNRMKTIPKSCDKCAYYVSQGRRFADNDKVCFAYGSNGVLLNGKTKVSVERSNNCPLEEITYMT